MKDRKKEAQNNSNENEISFFKLFAFSDRFDKILITTGVLTALIAALLHPLIFFLYGRIAKTFVDIQNSKLLPINDSSSLNQTFGDSCFKPQLSNGEVYDFEERINDTIKWYIVISFLSLLTNYLANVCFNTSAERQIKKIRQKLFQSIIRQDMSFFDMNSPGELNSVIISNIENIKTALSYKCSEFVTMLCRGLACVTFAVIYAWKFSTVFLFIVPLMILSLNLMIRSIKKYTAEELKAYAIAGKIAQEVLSSIRTVIAFGIQKKAIHSYETNLTSAQNMAIKKGLSKGIFEGLFNLLFNTYFGLGLVYATYLTRVDCSYHAGNILSSFFCLIACTFSIGQAVPYLGDVAQAKGAAKKLFEIIQTKSKIDIFNTSDKRIKNFKGDIEFENVCFSYPQRPEVKVLQDFNLRIPAGKTVAFCGSSGCGKSTTVGLLQRFYLPSSGKIKIDNQNIEDLDLEWLRNQMALVSQEPILFTTSIKENIRLGRLDATDEEIFEAAKMANAHNFIMQLSHKYETQVGERGSQISGGQKQRIAIARALLRNPKILLLDEATSALDTQSELIVQDALDKAKVGRTTLVIAHRLSTIKNADLIIGFQDGQAKEIGNHDELMSLKGLYYELVTSQTKEQAEKKEAKLAESVESEQSENEQLEENDVFIRMASIKSKTSRDLKSETKQKKKRNPVRYELKLWKLQKSEIIWIVIGVLAQMLVGAIFPLISLVFSQIYAIFSIRDFGEQLRQSVLMMSVIIGLAVLNFLGSFGLNYALAICGAKLTKRVRVKMFESMLRQEISFHDMEQNRSSVLSSQLAANAPLCKGLTSDKLGLLCQGFSGMGLAITISFILNWKLAAIMFLFVPVSFFSGVIAGRSSTNTKVKGKTVVEEGGRIVTETVENIRTVVSLNREKYFFDEFKNVFEQKFKRTLAVLHLQAVSYSISNTLIFFIQITVFSFGYYLIKYDNLRVTDLYTVYSAMTFSSLILGRVYSQLPDQNKARQAAKTAFKIINRKSLIDSMSENGLRLESLIGNIEFKNVCFEYANRHGVKILNSINLTIKNGQTNALVGSSGCGKSTTISLLLRFYDPTSGVILLDGVDIKRLNVQWLRANIGIVSQEPVLFDYSIKENIINGDTSRSQIPVDEIIEAARQANINNIIENLPDKYDTIVGTKGSQLSGGEKQRIAIARALIRKPKILLLDEATSALDTQSEIIVQDALEKAQVGRTCIVIAHRLSTIQNANKISMIKDGQVVEEGSHSVLMQNKNFYFELYNQNLAN